MNFSRMPRALAIILSIPAAAGIGCIMVARTGCALIAATVDLAAQLSRGQHVDIPAIYGWYLNVQRDPGISRIRPAVIVKDGPRQES